MPDREKVVKGIEHCDFGSSSTCYEKECPYYQSHDCTDELKNDILALLKEQEPKSVLSNRECETLPNHYERKGFCPKCHQEMKFILNRNYCGFCGQAVKWGKVVNTRIEVNK